MSNLGGYKTATTLLKALGGPKKATVKLGVATAIAGYALIRGGEAALTQAVRALRATRTTPTHHHFTASGTDESSGLSFRAGQAYLILAQDNDVVLIELDDGPYLVSAEFLSRVSDYTAGPTTDSR